MKRVFKIFVNMLAVVMLAFATLSLTACEDIKKLEVTLQVYNYEYSKMYEEEEVKLTIDLQRHLAPKTVDKIIEYVNEGYYDGTVFYLLEGRTTQIMIGDLKFDGTTVTKSAIKPEIEGEFEHGTTKGSDLINDEGYIGLWRSWYAQDDGMNTFKSTNGMDSGRSTMYIPLDVLSDYDGYFCVFGKIDYSNKANDTGVNAVGAALSASNYTTYVVYYTGEYDASKPDEDYGLEFHCITTDQYNELSDEEQDEIFVATGDQYVGYNSYRIRIPKNSSDGKVGAMIKSARIV